MKGAFRPGDYLVIMPVSLLDVNPGDVIVYRDHNNLNDGVKTVHRVVAITQDGLVTKGDNNACIDKYPVKEGNLLGMVTHIERDGKTKRVSGGRSGLMHAYYLAARSEILRLIKNLGRSPYNWIRNYLLDTSKVNPTFRKIYLNNEDGSLIKYVFKGRTIAYWYPEINHFECKKPFDLFIQHPNKSSEREQLD